LEFFPIYLAGLELFHRFPLLLGGTEHRRRLAGNGILRPGVELPQRFKILLAQKEVDTPFGQNIKIGLRHDVFLLSNFNL